MSAKRMPGVAVPWPDGVAMAAGLPAPGTAARVRYRTMAIDGVNIFYREAGPRDAPVPLLLHGFSNSSFMFRDHRPPTLIAWGRRDPFFTVEGARAYLRDPPDAELHWLDAGHFALETHGGEIAALMRDFLGRHLRSTDR